MLKKNYRLRKRLDFRRAYQRGKTTKNRNFVIYYAPNKLGEHRIGFSVSKKIGKAVVRNRVKRKFREACREELGSFVKGYDYILIVRQPAIHESVSHLRRQIHGKLKELDLQPRQKKQQKKKHPRDAK